ncbi:hypothetical protein [Brachybacterium sp. UNK5269]|uniref:hypothetical protein n=1 Tax=Brachybacterium sp. UNK5269 TaxID=3408576 RepID=UPI003BB16BA9
MRIIARLLTPSGGPRRDAAAVADALQEAVRARPEHRAGRVHFQDSRTAGTVIAGVLALAGEDREQVAASLRSVLETVARTYAAQPGTRTAFVRLEAHPEGDRGTRVMPADVVAPATGPNVTTDDLAAHFGV